MRKKQKREEGEKSGTEKQREERGRKKGQEEEIWAGRVGDENAMRRNKEKGKDGRKVGQ